MVNKPSILTIIGIVVISLLAVLPLLTISSIKNVWTTESTPINGIVNDFTKNLSDEINDIVSNAINISGGSSNGTVISSGNNVVILSNGSSNAIVSNSGGGGIVSQITSSNGVCNSNIVGGPRNATISSTGVCNDQLAGGLGADKFVCGQGTDTVRDFNSKEGDIIIDRQNCETIL
jgi:hypothetical protein